MPVPDTPRMLHRRNCYANAKFWLPWKGRGMNETYSAEIYRQEGADFRTVRLHVRSDGSICLDAQDMGKLTKEIWGNDDYEFWVDVPATALPKLVFALIRERYSSRRSAVDEFRAF